MKGGHVVAENSQSVERKRRWQSLFASFSGWTLDAMDWMFLALCLPMIGKTFDLSLPSMGLLATATIAGSAIGGMAGGFVADKYGRVRMLTWTMTGYAIFTALCGFAQSFEQLLILRILVGIFLGGEWGAGASLVSEYWPEKYRARATAFVHSGWAVGYGLASFFFMNIVPVFGWRALFWVGIIPAIVAVIIRLNVPEPEQWVKSKELASTNAQSVKTPSSIIFSKAYLSRTILATILSSSMLLAYWGSASWLPSYLLKTQGLSIVSTGIFLILLNAGAFCGHLSLGTLADKKGRRWTFMIGLGASIIVTIIYVMIKDPQVLLLFGFVFGFFTYGYFGTMGAYLSELFPVEARASGVSFTFSAGRFVSMSSPYIIGWIGTAYGLAMGIGVTAAFYLIGMIVTWMLPETRQQVAVAEESQVLSSKA